jgi:hypothetical protein
VICLQTPTVFWEGGGGTIYFSQLLNVHGVNGVRQTEIHTAGPLVLQLSAFEIDMTIEI